MASKNLGARREAVKARHKAATAKIARNERGKGVKLSGSKYDPRREIKNIERYTAKQLDAYERELDSFMSRKTQFVPDARGRPLPAAKYNVLGNIQNKINANRLGSFESVKNVKVPHVGMTLGEADAAYTPDHPMAGNPAILSPTRKSKTRSTRIPNEKALDKLIRKEREKLDPNYSKKQEKRDRWNARLLTRYMDKDLQKRINKLDAFQFKVLYMVPQFMTALATTYEQAQMSLLDGTSKAFYNTLNSNSHKEVEALVTWAETLKAPATKRR